MNDFYTFQSYLKVDNGVSKDHKTEIILKEISTISQLVYYSNKAQLNTLCKGIKAIDSLIKMTHNLRIVTMNDVAESLLKLDTL